jgi:hypothetical protein
MGVASQRYHAVANEVAREVSEIEEITVDWKVGDGICGVGTILLVKL